jgi:(p)ppGpp synthase/HD superfamily hydrolase
MFRVMHSMLDESGGAASPVGGPIPAARQRAILRRRGAEMSEQKSPETSPPGIEVWSSARPALLAATGLAWTWHGHLTRKGRATSYLSHLLAVQGLVIESGGSPDQAIAALLHDALEDVPDRAARAEREREIRARFGEPVLRIVLDCTDTLPDETGEDKRPWRARKERFLERLAQAERASRLVVACDKRHNLGDLVWDLHHEGPPTLARFNAGPSEQLWYFESVIRICRARAPRRGAARPLPRPAPAPGRVPVFPRRLSARPFGAEK